MLIWTKAVFSIFFYKALKTDQQGSITIFLAIVFMGMILLIGLLVDLGRIKVAQNHIRRTANGSARSVLANYNSDLRNSFSLFAVNKTDTGQDFRNYLKLNVSSPAGQKVQLLDYHYEGSNVLLIHPLSNPEILKQQIFEDMKYRAPLELSQELINKFMQIRDMAKFYDKNNEVRKSNARIAQLMAGIDQSNRKISQTKEQLRTDKAKINKNRQTIEVLEKEANPQVQKAIAALHRENSALDKEMNRLRADIRAELSISQRTKLEIQLEMKRMAEDKGTDLYAAENPGIDAVKVHDGQVNQLNEGHAKRIKEDLERIEVNIQDTENALVEEQGSREVNDDIFAKIGLPAGTEAVSRTDNSKDPVYQDTENLENMKKEAEWFKKTHPEIDFTETEITGKIGGFETADGEKADNIAQKFQEIFTIINVKNHLTQMRNEIYLNEYALTYFSHLTTEPKGMENYLYRNNEAEYICYGTDSKRKAVAELYITRFALDSAAYFAFSKLPQEPLERTVFSLIMGSIQASVDTYKLLASKSTVPIAAMNPNNPLENITLTYKDHLRLFLLLHSDEKAKLTRITEVIKTRSSLDLHQSFTCIDGNAQLSIRMWFLPLAGVRDLERGPFGSRIKNGRCYISKDVEFSY